MIDMENVKNELELYKALLDNAFERNDYISVVEKSEKITKLAYLLAVQRKE